MTGQRAPVDPVVEFSDRIGALSARLAELERVVAGDAARVAKAGDTMTGDLTIENPLAATLILQDLNGTGGAAMNAKVLLHDSAGVIQGRMGLETSVGIMYLQNTTGRVWVQTDEAEDIALKTNATSRLIVTGSGNVQDGQNRQFIRADTGRTSNIIIQSGSVTTGSTDVNGDFTITFPEAFSGTPEVLVTPNSILNRGFAVMSRSTTGFTVRMFATSTGAASASLSIRCAWLAYGPKATL